MSQAEIDVLAERQRQIFGEGFDEAHDQGYTHGELANAGACYAQPALRSIGWWPGGGLSASSIGISYVLPPLSLLKSTGWTREGA